MSSSTRRPRRLFRARSIAGYSSINVSSSPIRLLRARRLFRSRSDVAAADPNRRNRCQAEGSPRLEARPLSAFFIVSGASHRSTNSTSRDARRRCRWMLSIAQAPNGSSYHSAVDETRTTARHFSRSLSRCSRYALSSPRMHAWSSAWTPARDRAAEADWPGGGSDEMRVERRICAGVKK